MPIFLVGPILGEGGAVLDDGARLGLVFALLVASFFNIFKCLPSPLL
jgi:hypothetical protein